VTKETFKATTVPEPFGKPGGPGLFRIKHEHLPIYVQHVAHDLMEERGVVDESKAIRMALGIVENWSQGHDGKGNKVSAVVQAAAIKAMAEWHASIAKARAIPNQARHFPQHRNQRSGGVHMSAGTLETEALPVRPYYDAFGVQVELAMPPGLAAAKARRAPPNATGHPNAAKRERALNAGKAIPPKPGESKGKASFPVENEADFNKAKAMVQLAPPEKQAQIRRFLMRRARALGIANRIPANWKPDGTVG
jgi:hypothetical protein